MVEVTRIYGRLKNVFNFGAKMYDRSYGFMEDLEDGKMF